MAVLLSILISLISIPAKANIKITGPVCQLRSFTMSGYSRKGELNIGGIFSLHIGEPVSQIPFTELRDIKLCKQFPFTAYERLLAMIFATEEIQKDPKLLSNITLGYVIYDSCSTIAGAIEGTLRLLTGQAKPVPNYQCLSPVVAVIGESYSSTSIPMARLLGLYKFPQISHAATVMALSNKNQFPSFLRTIPMDLFQSNCIAHLIRYFSWTWVGLLSDSSDYGLQGSLKVKEELSKAGVCIAFFQTIPAVYSEMKIQHISEIIRTSSANVIVIYSNDVDLYPLMEVTAQNNVTGKVWIASDAWAEPYLFSKNEFLRTLQGTLGILVRKGDISGFREYIYSLNPYRNPDNIFLKNFWELVFNCKLQIQDKTNKNLTKESNVCAGDETLQGMTLDFFKLTELRNTYNVYNAIYAVAHALHDMISCRHGEGPFDNGTCALVHDFQPWQLFHYIKNVHFWNKNGEEVFFDIHGDPPAMFSIVNWQVTSENSFRYLDIGHFDATAADNQKLIMDVSAILWNEGHEKIPQSLCSESCSPGYRKVTQPGQPICCFNCIMCSQGEISNQTDSIDCLKCPKDGWPNERQDKCVKKANEFLSYEEPLGSVLIAISIFLEMTTAAILTVFIKCHHTPVVKANNRELSYLLLFSLILCFLCSFIFIGRPTHVTCMLRQSAFGIIYTLSISCVLAKTVVVVIAFNASKPNSSLRKYAGPRLPKLLIMFCTSVQIILCVSWLTASPPFLNENTTSVTGKIITECNEGSPVAFWCMLSYMGILAVVSLAVAFLSRKLPDSFNEAKFITFSMLVFVSVWMSFIPAYLSTQGKYMVAVEIFAIVSSGAGLLLCIFAPKCYIILLRPDMNTRDYLMGKGEFKN
ncbi:extracellular calcium-sensing receptor-like [Protopterus annectens]|uniref:extracellular calcium-sensing receptor-like n=1 Tax=Protopterus annectens TaxID=7888 RepID=UPI001CFAE746|nr:extracellular calcium-sensing receptor-like [Protopterus annectens]